VTVEVRMVGTFESTERKKGDDTDLITDPISGLQKKRNLVFDDQTKDKIEV